MADVVLFGFINAQITACGFLGGMVHAFNDEEATPWQVVKSIITGAVTANFLAPQALGVLAFLHPAFVYFVGFGIGLTGKHQCMALELIFKGKKAKNE
jgi:hypothetical protein